MEALLALSEHPAGVEVGPGHRMVYDLEADAALYGAAAVTGPALLWRLEPVPGDHRDPAGVRDAALARIVALDGSREWVMRCDRVDFPAGAVAHRHVHPGPGIRRMLFGELAVTTCGLTTTHRAGDPWFESGPDPVYAEASKTETSAFARVMILPAEWAGRRTIRYIDPADAERPALQRAKVLAEERLE